MSSLSPLPPPFDPNKNLHPMWRQAFHWLNQSHVLSPEANRILSLPTSTVEDLADILSDGIVLCNLLNYLVPGIIKYTDVSLRPQKSRFLCLQNIRLFLDACRQGLHFRDRDLFDPYMLFDKYDLDKIVETLSKISRLEVAKRKNLTPFPSSSPVNYANIQKEDNISILPIMRSLDEPIPTPDISMMNNDDDSRALLYYASPETIVAPVEQNTLYGCLIEKKRDNHKAFLPRDHCVKELLDTELNYRDSLNQIVTHFIEPLQLKIDERKKIFLNISEIHSLHSEFYEDLCRAGRNEKGRTSRIVELFTKWQDRFLIYAKYCSELPDAQEFLDRKIKQDSSFAQKLEQCRQKAGELGKFQLRDTVVLPFQRIVKYSLLLHTMKKNVPSTDPNGEIKRQLLEKAEHLMTDVNQYINEAKRAHDNLKVINNIEKTICDIKLPSDRCLRSYGRFIADEQFTVYEDGHRNGTRTIFLFDRVLLICKVKGSEKYTFRAALFIQGCQIEELKAAKREFPFILRDTMKHEFKFVAKTEEKRSFWLKNLRDAIDRCSNPEFSENGHFFQMKSFDDMSPRCDHCNRYLCGIFYQGYECSRCQKKLHRECIKKIGTCIHRASIARMQSFDRGSIELPRAFSNASNVNNHNHVYALYDYDGTLNNNNSRTAVNRFGDRHIKVNEGDELEILEDDDEHIWKVKNLRTNEIGLIPATLVGINDSNSQKTIQRSSTTLAETSSMVCDCETWYLDISRHQAEEILKNDSVPNNTFLVRKQGKNEGHAISIKHNNEVYHIRIYTHEFEGSIKHYLVDSLLFDSLQSLIQYYQTHSLEDRFPPVKSSLVHPIAHVCSHDMLLLPATL
ncbi:hypothetical protein I4U23_021227 [Adineta vaga]|nr:hypothetical protein I4U23_021227 [Adineta vaga]